MPVAVEVAVAVAVTVAVSVAVAVPVAVAVGVEVAVAVCVAVAVRVAVTVAVAVAVPVAVAVDVAVAVGVAVGVAVAIGVAAPGTFIDTVSIAKSVQSPSQLVRLKTTLVMLGPELSRTPMKVASPLASLITVNGPPSDAPPLNGWICAVN